MPPLTTKFTCCCCCSRVCDLCRGLGWRDDKHLISCHYNFSAIMRNICPSMSWVHLPNQHLVGDWSFHHIEWSVIGFSSSQDCPSRKVTILGCNPLHMRAFGVEDQHFITIHFVFIATIGDLGKRKLWVERPNCVSTIDSASCNKEWFTILLDGCLKSSLGKQAILSVDPDVSWRWWRLLTNVNFMYVCVAKNGEILG